MYMCVSLSLYIYIYSRTTSYSLLYGKMAEWTDSWMDDRMDGRGLSGWVDGDIFVKTITSIVNYLIGHLLMRLACPSLYFLVYRWGAYMNTYDGWMHCSSFLLVYRSIHFMISYPLHCIMPWCVYCIHEYIYIHSFMDWSTLPTRWMHGRMYGWMYGWRHIRLS